MSISSNVIVIDGGLSTELIEMGYDIKDSNLWTAKWLVKNPDIIKKAHINFLESGAQIIETSSYQLSVDNLINEIGCSEDEAKNFIRKSVRLAQEAVKESNKESALVAGSVGAYGACLGDGSEFSGHYATELSEKEENCDLLAIETIPSIKEADAILTLLKEFPSAKAWLSFSCKDGEHLCNGDLFKDAYNKFNNNPQLVAIGINCSYPNHITSLLSSVNRSVGSTPFVVYPNDGSIWDAENKCFISVDNSLDEIYRNIPKWIELGAKYIGGCCNTCSKNIRIIENICHNL